MGIFPSLRQFFYPPEFRIAPLKSFDLTTILKVITNLFDKEIPKTTSEESLQFLIDISNSLWRLHKKTLQPGTGQPLKEMRHAYRALTAAWNSLIQAGIMIREHTSHRYDLGLPLTVLSFQEIAGLTEPKVIETIKPTIYLQGCPIQFGEVIVGVPPISGQI